jgi:hypothetical protein
VSPDIVRKRLHASPFKPFELWLNSGQVVRVPHPEFALLPPRPNQWDMVVYEEDRTYAIIDLGEVAALKDISRSNGGGKRGKRRAA